MKSLQVHQPELTLSAETTLPADTIVEICAIEKKRSAVFCKICLSGGSDEQLLVQPCTCKGSMGHVHLSCLERWLNENGIGRCELCHFEFNVEERLRYSAGRALLIWWRSPSHRDSIRIDLAVILIMTLIIGILLYSISSGQDAISELTGEKELVDFVLFLFVFSLLLCYSLIVYTLIKDHFSSWWRWWRNCKDIVLRREQFCLEKVLVV